MVERTITKAEFEAAEKRVMEDQIKDANIAGMTKVLIPMTGRIFSDTMKKSFSRRKRRMKKYKTKPTKKQVENILKFYGVENLLTDKLKDPKTKQKLNNIYGGKSK